MLSQSLHSFQALIIFYREESGCDWKQQLEYYGNVQKMKKMKKEDWLKNAQARMKKEKIKKMELERFKTNQIGLAPPETQRIYEEELKKELKLDKGDFLKQAHKRIYEHKDFKYVPGTKKFYPAY